MPTPSIEGLRFHGGQATRGDLQSFFCKHSRLTCSGCSHVKQPCTCLFSPHHHLCTLLMKEEHLKLQAPDMSIVKVFKSSIILMPNNIDAKEKTAVLPNTVKLLCWFERHWGRLVVVLLGGRTRNCRRGRQQRDCKCLTMLLCFYPLEGSFYQEQIHYKRQKTQLFPR